MPNTKLLVLAPFALVAACGGSQQDAAAIASSAPTTQAAAATETVAAASEVAATTAVVAGEAPSAFTVCGACHSVAAGTNGVGPSLHAIVGTKAGEVAGFAFTDALKQSGITWDRESLDQWLQNPAKMVPGTAMVQTVPDAADRKAIIDYLEAQK